MKAQALKAQAPILVVEDNENDALLIRRTLKKAGLPNRALFLKTGERAICYLVGLGRYSDRKKYPLPAVLLLDLKLPGMNGFEVLERIRANPVCHDLRVVVLTSSEALKDVSKAYSLGANSFLVKPLEFDNIRAFFSTLEAQLSSKGDSAPVMPKRTRAQEAGPS